MTDINSLISSFPKRPPEAHKGDCGHTFVLAGSAGYSGAAYLTSQAAARSGSGLVTLAVGRGLYVVMASKLTEVMVRPFVETRDFSLSLLAEKDILAFSEKCNCVAIGPGISRNKETQNLVRNLIAKLSKPIILDADGINAIAGHPELLKNVKTVPVLTPHPGEMAALIGKDAEYVQKNRKEIALNFASEYNTVLVLKGYKTIVAKPGGDFYVNETGNAGMATGGCGDVLTGMIAAFVAQGLDIYNASVLGVYFHGAAGDLAANEKGLLGLIATDILDKIPQALKALA